MSETLVRVDNVSKKFCRSLRRSLWYGLQDLGSELTGKPHHSQDQLRPDEFWAIRDVSFELKRGECLGLIGHNGAGKTTLLRMLNGLIKPDSGQLEIRGRVGALIALGAGFHPLLTGRENIYTNALILGFNRKGVDTHLEEIIEFSGIAEHLDSPVQHYSSGMRVRLGFAIAAHLEPDLLLVDEALSVGDLAFTVKCLNRIASLRQNGVGVIFVSHQELQVREAASRCALLSHGRMICDGALDDAFRAYESSRDISNLEIDAGFVHDGPVRIDECEINGHATPTGIRTGEAMQIVLRCDSTLALSGARFQLRFWNAKGQVITSIDSVAQKQPLDLPQGRSIITMSIPLLAIVPGRYRLAGGFRRDGEVLGWARDLAHFEVMSPIDLEITEGFFITPATMRVSPDNSVKATP
jgi:lipopolysaccharide transport system ATP-binding protein